MATLKSVKCNSVSKWILKSFQFRKVTFQLDFRIIGIHPLLFECIWGGQCAAVCRFDVDKWCCIFIWRICCQRKVTDWLTRWGAGELKADKWLLVSKTFSGKIHMARNTPATATATATAQPTARASAPEPGLRWLANQLCHRHQLQSGPRPESTAAKTKRESLSSGRGSVATANAKSFQLQMLLMERGECLGEAPSMAK